jgi:hypothetical protein
VLVCYARYLARDNNVDDAILMLNEAKNELQIWSDSKLLLNYNLGRTYLLKKDYGQSFLYLRNFYRLKPSLWGMAILSLSFEALYSKVFILINVLCVLAAIILKLRMMLFLPIVIIIPRLLNFFFLVKYRMWKRVGTEICFFLLFSAGFAFFYFLVG